MNITQYAFFQALQALLFVEEIWLFGSRSRGDAQSRSDIDLAIICPSANKEDWHKVQEIIENADTLLKIDCVRFDTIKNDKFRSNILEDKTILYQKKG